MQSSDQFLYNTLILTRSGPVAGRGGGGGGKLGRGSPGGGVGVRGTAGAPFAPPRGAAPLPTGGEPHAPYPRRQRCRLADHLSRAPRAAAGERLSRIYPRVLRPIGPS
eukprot:1180384-Prorocentrum_minimum.AAC.2